MILGNWVTGRTEVAGPLRPLQGELWEIKPRGNHPFKAVDGEFGKMELFENKVADF